MWNLFYNFFASAKSDNSPADALPSVDQMQDILDIKGVGFWDLSWLFWLVAIGLSIVLILLVVFLIYFFFIKKKSPQAIVLTPLQRAYLSLEELEKSQQASKLSVRDFYFRLSEIFRTFLEEELHIMAVEATDEELKRNLNVIERGQQNESGLNWLIEVNALAKYAKYEPNSEEIQKSLATCRDLINDFAGANAAKQGGPV
ncbi:MAG: hypothetical protein H7A32_06010 [Deltaproteobacteria bacterium]|nr:hypothetical protein [Deltaproteobacteria bacterium]